MSEIRRERAAYIAAGGLARPLTARMSDAAARPLWEWLFANKADWARRTCHLCGRLNTKRVGPPMLLANPRGGKRLVRHKCPHGLWCGAGTRYGQMASNNTSACADCRGIRRAERDAGIPYGMSPGEFKLASEALANKKETQA